MRRRSTYAQPLDHTYLDRTIGDAHHGLIVDHLLGLFLIKAGDRVVELGAGSGRYTELLLRRGLIVDALEPDQSLAKKLRARLGLEPSLTIHKGSEKDLLRVLQEAEVVCGFHVIHHLNRENLLSLRRNLSLLISEGRLTAGWFFLEPNPLNVLYPLQILLTRAMSFNEEKGVWRTDYARILGSEEAQSVDLGTIGLFPPRPVVEALPIALQMKAATLKPGRSFLRLYRVYGKRLR